MTALALFFQISFINQDVAISLNCGSGRIIWYSQVRTKLIIFSLMQNDFQEKYSFRILNDSDIPEIFQLYVESFRENDIYCILGLKDEDNRDFIQKINLKKILALQLSIGVFHLQQLVSYTLVFDSQDDCIGDFQTTPANDKLTELLNGLSKAYLADPRHHLGEEINLFVICTSAAHTKRGLAQQALTHSCKAAVDKGYKRLLAEAVHIGTLRTIEKVCTEVSYLNRVEKLDGKPIFAALVLAKLVEKQAA